MKEIPKPINLIDIDVSPMPVSRFPIEEPYHSAPPLPPSTPKPSRSASVKRDGGSHPNPESPPAVRRKEDEVLVYSMDLEAELGQEIPEEATHVDLSVPAGRHVPRVTNNMDVSVQAERHVPRVTNHNVLNYDGRTAIIGASPAQAQEAAQAAAIQVATVAEARHEQAMQHLLDQAQTAMRYNPSRSRYHRQSSPAEGFS